MSFLYRYFPLLLLLFVKQYYEFLFPLAQERFILLSPPENLSWMNLNKFKQKIKQNVLDNFFDHFVFDRIKNH